MSQTLSKPVKDKHSAGGSDDRLLFALSAMQGWWEAHTAELTLKDKMGFSFFGVYDGHGGQNIAKYSGAHLHERIARDRKFPSDTAIINPKNHIYVGNAGDSRAVISILGEAKAMSNDHKPVNKEESNRITSAGGFGRVNDHHHHHSDQISKPKNKYRMRICDAPPELLEIIRPLPGTPLFRQTTTYAPSLNNSSPTTSTSPYYHHLAPPPQQTHPGIDISNAASMVARAPTRQLTNSKRAAQNRAAQRAFRQRKDRYIKDLEAKAKELEAMKKQSEALQEHKAEMSIIIKNLRNENAKLKGEEVIDDDGRHNGNSRAIGDFEFKQNPNLSPEDQIVTAFEALEKLTVKTLGISAEHISFLKKQLRNNLDIRSFIIKNTPKDYFLGLNKLRIKTALSIFGMLTWFIDATEASEQNSQKNNDVHHNTMACDNSAVVAAVINGTCTIIATVLGVVVSKWAAERRGRFMAVFD